MPRRWRSLSPWRIAKQVPAAKAVAAVLQRSNIQIVRGDINIATTFVGKDLNYPAMKNIQPQLGAFFRQADLDNAKDDVVYVPLTSTSGQIVGNNVLSGVAINAFWVESSDADQLEG
jgi:putative ABC transport system permease protein